VTKALAMWSADPMFWVYKYFFYIVQAAIYFNKIQCFCFEEQTLLPGEQIDMPVSSVGTVEYSEPTVVYNIVCTLLK
jgi:cytochrome c oxidase assembly protein Cox11